MYLRAIMGHYETSAYRIYFVLPDVGRVSPSADVETLYYCLSANPQFYSPRIFHSQEGGARSGGSGGLLKRCLYSRCLGRSLLLGSWHKTRTWPEWRGEVRVKQSTAGDIF